MTNPLDCKPVNVRKRNLINASLRAEQDMIKIYPFLMPRAQDDYEAAWRRAIAPLSLSTAFSTTEN